MKYIEIEDREKLYKLFEACEDSCLLTALSKVDGEVYADDEKNPTVSVLNVSDYSFIAATEGSKNIEEAVCFIDSLHNGREYNIRVVNKEIERVVEEVYKDRFYTYSRFATVRSFEYMDFDKLANAVNEKEKDFELRLIDEELFEVTKKTEWMEDFTIGYENYSEWEKTGLGVMFLKDGVPVSGASSYSAYPGGIEIEIITREDFRKQGLAFASGAALLIECRKRNLVASWDAAHKQSLSLAMKLGYKFLYEYKIYGIKGLQK